MAGTKVEIDAELEPLIPTYLENQTNNLKKMLQALENKDFETLRVLGHNLKGSGGGYGFEDLTQIGAAIEQAAKESKDDTIREKLTELEEFLAHVEITYV